MDFPEIIDGLAFRAPEASNHFKLQGEIPKVGILDESGEGNTHEPRSLRRNLGPHTVPGSSADADGSSADGDHESGGVGRGGWVKQALQAK